MLQRWTDFGSPPINPPGSYTEESPQAQARLNALGERVQADLFALRHPETPWMPQRNGPDGKPMLDVLIVGAGQGGLAVAGLLMRERVDNILLIDKSAYGQEGAWNDFARTPVIRSPKHYPGPDMGVPSLTYEAWHRARFGDGNWDALVFVTIERWVEYLAWVREILALPVRNETTLVAIEATPDALALKLRDAQGGTETVFARRLVLATGHDGTGSWWMPEFISALPVHLRAHAAEPIDFSDLAGKKVAVSTLR